MFKHTHMFMATKTITIMEDAYEALSREKLPNESFSDVIRRVTKKSGGLEEFFGCITKEDADIIEREIAKQRELGRKRNVWG